jgi:hypothetical protein
LYPSAQFVGYGNQRVGELEGKNEDEEGNLVHDMRRLGYQSTFDEVFYRTLSKLHELELDKVDDEEELLVHLPSWGTAEENPGRCGWYGGSCKETSSSKVYISRRGRCSHTSSQES